MAHGLTLFFLMKTKNKNFIVGFLNIVFFFCFRFDDEGAMDLLSIMLTRVGVMS